MAGQYGLLIGSSEYHSAGLKRLVGPPSDVTALGDALVATGDFQIQTLLNQTRSVVELAIQQFFAHRDPDDLALLYFSGHGLKNERNNLFFAMTDTDSEYLEASAVAASFVRERMAECYAKKQVVLLDCCFSGAFARGSTFKAGDNIDSGLYFNAEGSGQAILTASDQMQYAFEGKDLLQQNVTGSIFTEILVTGIRTGKADVNDDGYISINDLEIFLVRELTARKANQRAKKWTFDLDGDIVITRNPNPGLGALTPDIRALVESDLAQWRQLAVAQLLNLARSEDRLKAMAALNALRQLTRDDSKAVSAAADASLSQLLPRTEGSAVPPEKERKSPPPEVDSAASNVSNEVLASGVSQLSIAASLNQDSSIKDNRPTLAHESQSPETTVASVGSQAEGKSSLTVSGAVKQRSRLWSGILISCLPVVWPICLVSFNFLSLYSFYLNSGQQQTRQSWLLFFHIFRGAEVVLAGVAVKFLLTKKRDSMFTISLVSLIVLAVWDVQYTLAMIVGLTPTSYFGWIKYPSLLLLLGAACAFIRVLFANPNRTSLIGSACLVILLIRLYGAVQGPIAPLVSLVLVLISFIPPGRFIVSTLKADKARNRAMGV